jgi:hypothetical protein
MVGYISSSVTTKRISHYKDDVIEFIVVPKVIHDDTEKVEDVVISLLSIKGDSQF